MIIIFWDWLIFYQVLLLALVTQSVIISDERNTHEFSLQVAELLKT